MVDVAKLARRNVLQVDSVGGEGNDESLRHVGGVDDVGVPGRVEGRNSHACLPIDEEQVATNLDENPIGDESEREGEETDRLRGANWAMLTRN